MKKKILSLVLVVAMITSLASCGSANGGNSGKGSATPDEGSSDKGSDSGTFVIGGIGPLSGNAASYGVSVKQGAEVAVKEINDAGGIKVGDKTLKVELQFEDDEASAEKSPNAYNALADKVDVIMGAVTSDACIAITDLTKQDNMLQITPSGSAQECTKNDNNFRLCFTDPLQGRTMAKLAVSDLNYKKVAVIFNNSDPYSSGMKDAFVEEVKKLGGEVVAEEGFNKDDVDFNTQLTKIKGTDAQCIFVPSYYKEAGLITTQAAAKGIKLPFLGGDGWDGVIDQVQDKSVIEGAIFLSPFLSSNPDEKIQKFVKAYEAAYKATPDQFAADGYDTVYTFKAAIEKAGSTDSSEMIKAMTEITVEGVTGTMTFTADGEPNKDAQFVVIKDGKYTAR